VRPTTVVREEFGKAETVGRVCISEVKAGLSDVVARSVPVGRAVTRAVCKRGVMVKKAKRSMTKERKLEDIASSEKLNALKALVS
jgi:hypothetical protein